MPHSHKGYMQWTPDKIRRWADSAGAGVSLFINKIVETCGHKEHAFRMCLGVMHLSKRYSHERLENACSIALSAESYKYRTLKAILKNRMDENTAIEQNREPSSDIIIHKNIRGNSFYAGCDL